MSEAVREAAWLQREGAGGAAACCRRSPPAPRLIPLPSISLSVFLCREFERKLAAAERKVYALTKERDALK